MVQHEQRVHARAQRLPAPVEFAAGYRPADLVLMCLDSGV
jgi:hypothetical protein